MNVEEYIKHNLVHSIHTTGRRSYRGCRRRWAWVFREFYYPTITAKPLEFGVAFHVAMETLYNPETWHEPATAYNLARVAFKRVVEEQRAKYLKTVLVMSDEEKQDYDDRVKLGLGMLHYYFTKIMPLFEYGQFTPVSVEQKFEVPITSPSGEQLWCRCNDCWRRFRTWSKENWPEWEADFAKERPDEDEYRQHDWIGLPVTYGGRIDLLVVDQYGRYWILDWKTAAQLTQDENDDYLLVEDQITSYIWAMRKLLGLDIAGFIYAEIKKAVPTEPEPLSRPFKGRLYSTNKQNNYDLELYVKTVEEGDPNGYADGLYDEFIEYLKEGGATLFHRRFQVDRNDDELASAGYYIYLEAKEMIDPDLALYPSPGRFGCKTCAFQEPCVATNKGEDAFFILEGLFEKRDRHYWEEAPPSTDKPGRT